ncbi:hypothetical protein FHT40_002224 [Mycolicibacterium sp. BK556]|uniref:hypothetical protein n=1 Tax=Mycobacteriaceae TaxID=1762 RepID=UPI00105FA5EF|nr:MULTISPECIES: hypothetical protein [Mycobacteriaceae]MBB3602591.1 hypothetical protein [Mycolicibacterium sp. BK556]MBB3632343.1 hypothetical protein [Mycolicibacterium sp. BK607]MBB3750364.1 hypothetical protein [Mycolicibacterium sp. BK634]TDO18367.1 hypothetical protein EV580_1554 [Mycobacterium sp. BK086]
MNRRQIIWKFGLASTSVVMSLGGSPIASADGESGAVTGAGFGPSAGVGDASSYTGGSTSNSLCGESSPYPGAFPANICAGASVGVGDASSYTGGTTVNNPGGTASLGVGDVSSYTGGGTPGIADNGTNSTTRTVNYGPGHP